MRHRPSFAALLALVGVLVLGIAAPASAESGDTGGTRATHVNDTQGDDRFMVSGLGDSVAAEFGLHSARLVGSGSAGAQAAQSGRRCGSFVDFIYETLDFEYSNTARWRITGHQLPCGRANPIMRAYHFRSKTPRGWSCASSDAEAACWRGPSSESGPRVSVVTERSLGRLCNIGALYTTTGVGAVWHHAMSCRRVKRIMRRWGQDPYPRSKSPGGFRCRTHRPDAGEPGASTHYWCRKGGRLMRFAVGG